MSLGHIILAFSKDATADKIRRMLEQSGFSVFAQVHSAADTLRLVNGLDGALVITCFKLPDATVNDLFADLPRSAGLIALLSPEQQGFITDGEIFVLPLPTSAVRLCGAVDLMLGGWQKKSRRKPKRRSEDDKLAIGRAKQMLMEQNGFTEEQAYRFLQKKSMDTGEGLAKTARMLIGE